MFKPIMRKKTMNKQVKKLTEQLNYTNEDLTTIEEEAKNKLQKDKNLKQTVKMFKEQSDSQKEYIESEIESIDDRFEKNKVFLSTIIMGVFLNILASQIDIAMSEILKDNTQGMILYRVIIFLIALLVLGYVIWKMQFQDRKKKAKLTHLKSTNTRLTRALDKYEENIYTSN